MNFVKDVAERALSAGAAAVLASLSGSVTSLYEVNPGTALGVGGFAALITVLGALATRRAGSNKDSASVL